MPTGTAPTKNHRAERVVRLALENATGDPSAQALLNDFADALTTYERLYGDGKKTFEFLPESVSDETTIDGLVWAAPMGDKQNSHDASTQYAILYEPAVDYVLLARSPRLGWLRRPVSEAIDALVLDARCGKPRSEAIATLKFPRRAALWALGATRRLFAVRQIQTSL